MKYKLLPVWVVILSILLGCGGPSSQVAKSIPITVLLEAGQCQSQDIVASAYWIRDAQFLDPSLAQKIKADHPDAIPWDSTIEGLLVIHMGRQSTGGYRLSLASSTLQVSNGIGIVTVMRHRPAIGAIVSQVIASPCLVLQIPFINLKSLRIYDQNGRRLDEVTVR